MCDAVGGVKGLSTRIKALELGRSGASHVMNFEEPSRIAAEQYYQTEDMLKDPEMTGLEFVRAWDSGAVSIISLMPFVLSLVFAGVWIGVSIGKHNVDPQVATQTALTVAAFIVTAGEPTS